MTKYPPHTNTMGCPLKVAMHPSSVLRRPSIQMHHQPQPMIPQEEPETAFRSQTRTSARWRCTSLSRATTVRSAATATLVGASSHSIPRPASSCLCYAVHADADTDDELLTRIASERLQPGPASRGPRIMQLVSTGLELKLGCTRWCWSAS